MKPILVLGSADKAALTSLLAGLTTSPYQQYPVFHAEVAALAASDQVPEAFVRACEYIRDARSRNGELAYFIRNCPLDPAIPVFDQDDPVTDKYRQKTTFIGEAFLELFAQLTGTPLLAYETRNNGDFFHDVYAHNRYSGTQTQKTDGELYFHNDRTAHPVRADYLSLLGMRCHPGNRIYTGYVDGRRILDHLSAEQQALLRQPLYWTPFDEYSRDSNRLQVNSLPHVILEEVHCFRYYDTRTKPLPDAPVEARDAVIALKDAIVKASKVHVQIEEGDLLSFPNQAGLHNRDIIEVADSEQARLRWLLKTYSFRDVFYMRRFKSSFQSGIDGFVCDAEATPLAA
jgi:L-asparagine oxygenase